MMYRYINDLAKTYKKLEIIKEEIWEAYLLIEACYKQGNKLLIAGNGGSAADAEHILGELMKSFKRPRPIREELFKKLNSIGSPRGEVLAKNLQEPLPAISLVNNVALATAFANDVRAELLYAQELLGYGKEGDVLLAISTSGNSQNVVDAAILAKAMGVKVIGLTGVDGGELTNWSDVMVKVPEKETYLVQEMHLPIYHRWCMMLEEKFFG